jgi:hypothetical protein
MNINRAQQGGKLLRFLTIYEKPMRLPGDLLRVPFYKNNRNYFVPLVTFGHVRVSLKKRKWKSRKKSDNYTAPWVPLIC